ncbi:hypothetical protein F3Y22_tig00116989pilonHSYRG00559 [Hibiscus syriacus]|uniref:Uncharacterized protein n=1 Tax=Hibiscus syriacus TaxID=106335 RepID=A0A6A2WPB4_HIBSY|nr:hypothetical protein F3Y22_tig00116989pilonHSYRG00559 [Hibiscus syriacus]
MEGMVQGHEDGRVVLLSTRVSRITSGAEELAVFRRMEVKAMRNYGILLWIHELIVATVWEFKRLAIDGINSSFLLGFMD